MEKSVAWSCGMREWLSRADAKEMFEKDPPYTPRIYYFLSCLQDPQGNALFHPFNYKRS